MAWLAGWSHRKTTTITGQTGAGTDYQVNLSIGDASGGDFHLENNCTSFPNDIIVTDNDQTSLLDHWVEDLTVDPISMWVEVADDLGSNADVCVYYTKSGESSASNGTNTFVAYHGTASSNFHDSNIIPGGSIIFEAKARQTSDSEYIGWGCGESDNLQESPGDSISITTYHSGATIREYIRCRNDGSQDYDFKVAHFTQNTWHRIKAVLNAGILAQGYVDGVEIDYWGGVESNLPNEALGLAMDIDAGTGEQEWSFARKYNDPEPAYSSAGSEENAPVAGHPTMARWHGIPGMNYTGRTGVGW